MSLELFSAILSFLGGAFLSIDALRSRERIRAESGASKFLEVLKKETATDLRDEHGAPLKSEAALRLWLTNQSTRWAWLGFALMTVGFVLQILAVLMRPPT